MTGHEKVRNFITENFLFGDGATLQDNDSLHGKGIIDSTGVLALIAFLEEQFGIVVGDNDVRPENLDTIDRIVKFIDTKMPGSN
ncbi:MAG: acyl carrier protein [bacterium]